MTGIEDSVKEQIQVSIKMLNAILEEKVNDYELSDWIPNCIQCLQFALDNEDILIEKPSLYQDTVSTLYLLSEWIVNNEWYAYIELREKFKTVFSGEEVGKSLKCLLNRMQELKTLSEEPALADYPIYQDGKFKSVEQILTELGEMWNIGDKK